MPRGRSKKLTTAEFTLLAIKKLSKPPHKSIHSVWSGFNAAFRDYFPELDPVKEIQKLEKAEIVSTRPTKGGFLIFPGKVETQAQQTLKKMGL